MTEQAPDVATAGEDGNAEAAAVSSPASHQSG